MTAAKLAAYVIAGIVHGSALAFAAGGVLLIALAFPSIPAIVAGVALVTLAILMRPRFGKPPKEDTVAREEAPRLYALLEEVAGALETPPPDVVVVDEDYNAWWAILGLPRRRVLSLGLPLLTVLGPQERVALIAHELAHARNGDSTRGLFVGSAIRGLEEIVYLLRGEAGLSYSDFAIAEWLARGFLWLLALPVRALLVLELQLLLRDSQRAEYLADLKSAHVAGAQAAVGVQEKILLSSFVRGVALTSAHHRRDGESFFREVEAAFTEVPERERERRRRAARLEGVRLDATHPPTARRIELIESSANGAKARIVLEDAWNAAIDAELARLREPIGARIVEGARDSLYA